MFSILRAGQRPGVRLIGATALGDLRPGRRRPHPDQPAVDGYAPEDELHPGAAQRPRRALPGRADPGPGRPDGPGHPPVRPGLDAPAAGTDHPADHPLPGRGRGAVRPHRHHRPRSNPGLRHARRLEAPGPIGIGVPHRGRSPGVPARSGRPPAGHRAGLPSSPTRPRAGRG